MYNVVLAFKDNWQRGDCTIPHVTVLFNLRSCEVVLYDFLKYFITVNLVNS